MIVVPPSLLIDEVCRVSRMPRRKLTSRTRLRNVVRLRHAIWYVVRRKSVRAGKPLSYPQLGLMFGGCDHTTVIHGCRTTLDLLKHGDKQTLRAYKIAIRAYVKLQQQELARREEVRRAVEKFDAAVEAARECELLTA